DSPGGPLRRGRNHSNHPSFFAPQSEMPFRSSLAIVKNSKLVTQPPCRQRLDIQLYCLLRDPSGFVKPAETSVSVRQVRIRKAVRRVAPERLLPFFNSEIEIAEHIVDIGQTVNGLIFFLKHTIHG